MFKPFHRETWRFQTTTTNCTSTCQAQILIQQTFPATAMEIQIVPLKSYRPENWKLTDPSEKWRVERWKFSFKNYCPFLGVPFLPFPEGIIPPIHPFPTVESDTVCVKLGVVDFLCIDLLPRSKKRQFRHLEDGIVASSRNAISWEHAKKIPLSECRKAQHVKDQKCYVQYLSVCLNYLKAIHSCLYPILAVLYTFLSAEIFWKIDLFVEYSARPEDHWVFALTLVMYSLSLFGDIWGVSGYG